MGVIHTVGTKDVQTARRLVAILTDENSLEGQVLEKVCGYRSVFFILLRVASPAFTPKTRKLAARTIREMRALLLHPIPFEEENETNETNGTNEMKEEENKRKNETDEKENKTKQRKLRLPSTYNVRT